MGLEGLAQHLGSGKSGLPGLDQVGQPLVEAASIATALSMAREVLWDPLSPRAKETLIAWLRPALRHQKLGNNWVFFPAVIAAFLASVDGAGRSAVDAQSRAIEAIARWHIGRGWYTDGEHGGVDFDIGGGTGAYRVQIYQTAVEEMAAPWRWLIGTGTNSFSQFHSIDQTNVGKAYLSSVWLSIPYDAGLVGAVSFFASVLFMWLRSGRRADSLPLFVVILVGATTTNCFWFAFVWVCFALVGAEGAPFRSVIQARRPAL